MLRRPPLHYPDRPFHHFLRDAVDRSPERVAFRYDDEVSTFRELEGCANAFANALIGLGVGPGDRVALVVPNRPEWLVADEARKVDPVQIGHATSPPSHPS